MKKLFFISLLLMSSFVSATTAFDYSKINIKDGLSLLDGNMNDIDSVAVSNDGNQICWIGKKTTNKLLYPVNLYVKDVSESAVISPKKINKFLLNAFTKCAFDEKGNIVSSALKYRPFSIMATVIGSLRTGDYEPKLFRSSMRIFDKNTFSMLEDLNAVDMGQTSMKAYIKHPRVSPDGRWITYYTMGEQGKKGIYLYNRVTTTVIHLGEFSDKHPTWNSEGDKILFHYQTSNRKEGGLEKSYLGYFELSFSGEDQVDFKRILIDDIEAKGYVYHKHPALYPGTNLLFFHGQKKEDGNKKIFVRNLAKNSKIYEVDMDKANVNLKKAKHPAVSRVDSGLYFLGKEDIKKSKYKIYKLSPKFIKKIESKVE